MTPSADVSGNTAQYRPDEPDDSDESDAPSKYVAVKNPVNATAAVAVGHALILDQTLALVMPPGSWGWVPAGVRERLPGMPRRAGAYKSSDSFTTIDLPAR
jgi:hypothetical protein